MVTIRSAEPHDAEQFVTLMAALGYPTTAEIMAAKLRRVTQSASDHVFAAIDGAVPIGCIGCHTMELLHVPGYVGRITVLVVASSHQRRGVGSLLVTAAERFFRSLGCVRIEVTSGSRRADAHAFYGALGFADTGRRFVRSLLS